MRYGELLQKAFVTAWKYKYLWVLGFFADTTSFFGIFNDERSEFGRHIWADFPDPASLDLNLGLSIFAIFLIVCVVLALIILERIAEGGLICNAAHIERGERHNLSIAWDAGMKYFLRMLGILVFYLVLIFTFIIALGIIGVIAALIATPLLVLSLVFLIPLFFCGLFVLAIGFAYSERFVVIGDQGLFKAVESGFRLFKANPGRSTTMGVIQLLIVIGFVMGLTIVFVILVLPLIILGFFSNLLKFAPWLFIILPLAAVIHAYFTTYRSCVWTYTFMQLRYGPTAVPPVSGANLAPDAPSAPKPPQFE